MKLPKLYKTTSTGALQFWEIEVLHRTIVTTYGQVGTESPQTTHDIILEGKNAGRANATTAEQQAELEAKAKWTKQLKKGYVDNIQAAAAGLRDKIITGGIDPMLAKKYSQNGVLTSDAKKIKFPCFGQPKMDGIRCIAIKKDGVCTLWTRTRKPILSVPHIARAIEKLDGDFILDGELYNHDYRQDFDTIIELVRPDEPREGHEVVQFWTYDIVNEQQYKDRKITLQKKIEEAMDKGLHGILVWVETHEVPDAASVPGFHELMLEHGFEGFMLRNADGLYVNKRSYDLQKVKEMTDEEFKIVDFEEGKGRLSGHVGSFWCVTNDDSPKGAGIRFKAKPKGKTAKLKDYFKDHSLWRDKLLTVQFQNYTPDGKPRFPVGKGIRDYE